MHQTLLDMSAGDRVCQGTFACTHFASNGNDVFYFYESGSYTGFAHNKLVDILRGKSLIKENEQPLLYRIFSAQDRMLRSQYLQQRANSISNKRSSSSQGRTLKNRGAQVYNNKLIQLQSQISNIRSVSQDPDKSGILKNMFVHTLKYNAHMDSSDHK